MRARHYEAVAAGMPLEQAVHEAAQLHAGVEHRMAQALQNPQAAAEYVYNQQVECAKDHGQIGSTIGNDRRGTTPNGGGGGLFGNPFAQQPAQTQQPNPFVPSNQTPFGQPAQPQQPQAGNPFAQNTQPQQQQQPAFGQPSFGQPSFGQSGLGSTAQPAFGQSGFGRSLGAGNNPNPNPFLPAPQQNPPVISQTGFGRTQGAGFAQQQQPQPEQPNPFAQPSQPAAPAPPSTGFGVGSGFGNNAPQANPFSVFGNQPAPQQPQQQNPFQTNNPLTQQPNANPNPFGSQPPAASQPNPFGQPAAPAPSAPAPAPAPAPAQEAAQASQAITETAPAPNLSPANKLYDVPPNLNPTPHLTGTTAIDPVTKRLSYFKGRPVQYIDDEPRYQHPDFPGIYVRVMLPNGRPPPHALRDAVGRDEDYTPDIVEFYRKAKEGAGFEAGKVPLVPPKVEWCDYDL